MTVATSFYSYLSNAPSLTALVGNRIYPIMLPQDAVFPAITYNRVTTPKMYVQSGFTYSDAHYDVNCWGISYDAADTLAATLIPLLDNRVFSGVTMCRILDDKDLRDPDTGLFRRILTIDMFTEAVA